MIKEELYNEITLNTKQEFEGVNIRVDFQNFQSYFTKTGKFDKRKKGFRVKFFITYDQNVTNLVELLELFYSKVKVIIKGYEDKVFFFDMISSGYGGDSGITILYSLYFSDYSSLAKKKLQR